jgi:hypothetical protein
LRRGSAAKPPGGGLNNVFKPIPRRTQNSVASTPAAEAGVKASLNNSYIRFFFEYRQKIWYHIWEIKEIIDMKKVLFGLFAIIGGAGAAHAAAVGGDPCILILQMMPVFRTLRTLAFVGAAFMIAGWAWGYISKGEAKMDDLKKQGIGLLVGFTLLFGIGIVLQFLGPVTGCVVSAFN